MPNIEITHPTFSRLQGYAIALVDSPETALIKVLDIADAANNRAAGESASSLPKSAAVPDLTYASPTSATIDGELVSPSLCNWNAILVAVAEKAAKQLPRDTAIRDLIVVNNVPGQKEDNGYKFIKSLGISIQGQSANGAWKAISHLARTTGVIVEVNFYWSDHPKAAKPGETGRLSA